MRFLFLIGGVCVFALALVNPAFAQDDAVAQDADSFLEEQKIVEAPVQKTGDKTPESPEVLEKKVALARKMHEINPVRNQVDAAVERAAYSLPEQERKAFVNSMRSILNYNAIERISIDSMAQVYTVPELEAMVAYYSKPEAQSASAKMGQWAALVQPEIIRIIDKAMIKIRTGE